LPDFRDYSMGALTLQLGGPLPGKVTLTLSGFVQHPKTRVGCNIPVDGVLLGEAANKPANSARSVNPLQPR
jgi:hypothetical protein